jgi:hypothetical protein
MSVVLMILATMAAQQSSHIARAGLEAPGSSTLICGTVRETYTRIPRRVCLTAEELQARVEAAERSIPRPPRLVF